jgi:hypothetical protein
MRNRLDRPSVGTAFVALFLSLTACDALFGPGSSDEPALIIFYRDTSTITVRDTVVADTPFAVSVVTFAGGCRWETAPTEGSALGMALEIRCWPRDHDGLG